MAEPGRAGGSPEPLVQVSIILPVHNSECWLDECLKSVWEQDFEGTMELSIFNDASKDGSAEIIEKWKIKLEEVGVSVIIGINNSSQPRGVGFAKNQAVIQSSGTYLCFLDSDDVMMPQRVRLQHQVAIQHPNSGYPLILCYLKDFCFKKRGDVSWICSLLVLLMDVPAAPTLGMLKENHWTWE